MAQYIDKADIMAEIEKRKQELRPTNTHKMQVGEKIDRDVLMWLNALTWVKKFLDTLEVKEVDFDKEYSEFLQREWFDKNCNRTMSEMMAFTAKHFYKLGMAASNKSQKGE